VLYLCQSGATKIGPALASIMARAYDVNHSHPARPVHARGSFMLIRTPTDVDTFRPRSAGRSRRAFALPGSSMRFSKASPVASGVRSKQ